MDSSVVPDIALARQPSSATFRVSDAMVERFATLTGDRSSLHVSDGFARRSAFRQPVVHGMLPIGFLAALAPFRVAGVRCVPLAISGRFLAPVFRGDQLVVTAEPGHVVGDNGEVAFAFRIEQRGSGATVTAGEITVAYHPVAQSLGRAPVAQSGDGASLLRQPLELNDVRLEQIEKGMKDRIAFSISRETIASFGELVEGGLAADDPSKRGRLSHDLAVANVLAMLLFSTSVGVSMPGASATFLEFTARADGEMALDTAFVMEGEVVHRSSGTRIVKKQMLVRRAGPEDAVVLRGKVATLVNEPSRVMPTMAELKGSATDLGLSGKVALITGASRGIGETIAKLFAAHGAKVIVNYHRGASDAARVVKEITDSSGDALAVAADVTRADDVRALVEAGVARYGGVDVLVNNAVRDYRPIPFAQLSWDDIQNDLDVIAKGAFLCCQHVLPLMLQRGGGKVVNISSVAVDDPPPGQTKYVVAKSALVGLTRSISIEYAARNIQANLVVANFVETDLVAHVNEGFRKRIAQDTPMGRHALAVDVAQAVVFLASRFASFTTGQKIMVTGGGAPYL